MIFAPPELPSIPGISPILVDYLRRFAVWADKQFSYKLASDIAIDGILFQTYNVADPDDAKVYKLQVNNAGAATLAPMPLGSINAGTPVPIGVTGVTDGSSAPAGAIGEYITASGGNVALTNNVVINVLTMPLPAGDWDVEGMVFFTLQSPYGSAVVTAVSPASASFPAPQPGRTQYNAAAANISVWGQPTGAMRFSSSAASTVYLVALVLMGGTGTGQGFIRARRVR